MQLYLKIRGAKLKIICNRGGGPYKNLKSKIKKNFSSFSAQKIFLKIKIKKLFVKNIFEKIYN